MRGGGGGWGVIKKEKTRKHPLTHPPHHQLYHNAQRKSTIGFNVSNAATDAVGGALSLAQQALDAFIFRDASLLIGNPAKLALAALSLAYDAGLMVQHYCLYTERGEAAAAGYESLEGGAVATV